MRHTLIRLGAAVGLAGLLCGSFCAVTVCNEDCDPCLRECKCHDRPCGPATAADFEAAHQLTSFRESVQLEADGRATRVWSEIAGLSVRRATGRSDVWASDVVRFAEGVLRVNAAELGAPRGSRWELEAIETFEAASIVAYASRPEGATLSLCFDRAGNLIEIDEVFAAR